MRKKSCFMSRLLEFRRYRSLQLNDSFVVPDPNVLRISVRDAFEYADSDGGGMRDKRFGVQIMKSRFEILQQ